ncbi:hypothetical protein [Acinetobacter courvalinii]|uniref:hypothetical protein n=1 Tax=Acinetobacter courvalinii TaxID=280147 RepID=UPI0028A29E5C|nr:hypothetical protein [Acinetobacter courvalinii]
MNKLDLCPLQESYSVKYGTSVERIALRGGFGRYVQTKDAKKHLVDVAFTLLEDDFIYFRAFYLNWQLNPLPFLMSLIIEDSDFREYIAQFVPESFSFNELNGNVFKVSAQLVVVTNEVKILTSKPYPLYFLESVKNAFEVNGALKKEALNVNEETLTSFEMGDVSFRTPTFTYEQLEHTSSSLSMDEVKITYKTSFVTMPPPETTTSSFSIDEVQISKQVRYIVMADQLPETTKSSFTMEGVQKTN